MFSKTMFFCALCALFLFISCKKDYLSKDKETIENYLIQQGLTATSTPEGVYFISEIEGTGANPTINNTVTVHYDGYLLDGTSFDSSIGGLPARFGLWQVIEGWQVGIPLLKKGGKGKLLIPSPLGYGGNPPPGSTIPSNAILIFDVQLIDIE